MDQAQRVRDLETFGRNPWQGRETLPQLGRPCHSRGMARSPPADGAY